ncbi:hypothetical protein SKAU_G00177790 [Synaphobranchus kaupii]|uniref:Uncharacterized protein n=1 Tax=Synaphobranchus kaupii TaxID=118154 RepID=A0A9Q1FMB4_SYNKA|nr:hypothetical protein SKAU_G00177790 [Synaphobranchus kaupii]
MRSLLVGRAVVACSSGRIGGLVSVPRMMLALDTSTQAAAFQQVQADDARVRDVSSTHASPLSSPSSSSLPPSLMSAVWRWASTPREVGARRCCGVPLAGQGRWSVYLVEEDWFPGRRSPHCAVPASFPDGGGSVALVLELELELGSRVQYGPARRTGSTGLVASLAVVVACVSSGPPRRRPP